MCSICVVYFFHMSDIKWHDETHFDNRRSPKCTPPKVILYIIFLISVRRATDRSVRSRNSKYYIIYKQQEDHDPLVTTHFSYVLIRIYLVVLFFFSIRDLFRDFGFAFHTFGLWAVSESNECGQLCRHSHVIYSLVHLHIVSDIGGQMTRYLTTNAIVERCKQTIWKLNKPHYTLAICPLNLANCVGGVRCFSSDWDLNTYSLFLRFFIHNFSETTSMYACRIGLRWPLT